MKDLTGKTFKIEDKEFEILADGRKGEGYIGFGLVMFKEIGKPLPEDGSCYSESGYYFSDNPPYFDEAGWLKRNS